MCSIETEKRIAKLFMILAEGERSIEISRQVLSDLKEFDSYQIFKNLDYESKNKIDAYNIIDYLKNKGIYSSEEEAQLIVLFYDQDYDTYLSFTEFINLIQSEKILQKSSCRSPGEELSYNVDYSFGKLLEKEVELARNVLYALKDIKCRYDFNIHNLFHSVKSYNTITPESVRNFLEKYSVQYLDSDIKAIIKRLDFNKDGRIDLCEFHALLGFPNCGFCCPCISCDSCGACYCDSCFTNYPCYLHVKIDDNNNNSFNLNNYNSMRINNNLKTNTLNNNYINNNNNYTMPPQKNLQLSQPLNTKINYFSSPIINDDDDNDNKEVQKKQLSNSLSIRRSPERKYAPIQVELCNNCNQIPCICGQLNRKENNNNYNNSEINLNNFNINTNNNLQNNTNLNEFEKNQFNDFLKMLMKAETEIEQRKIDLSLNPDFNCEDAFRIFEKNGRGFLTKDDLKYGLYLLGINTSDFIINLLFKRFDLQKEDEINYADFFDILIPFEKKFRNDVEQRPPRSFCAINNIEIFSEKTIICLRNVLNLIINLENEINEMRKGFSILIRRIKDIFKMFDLQGLGFFNFKDFIRYLKDNDMLDESLNVDLLFIRLDKNRNGKIDFTEIADEIEALY